jgi:ParB family chromosome partitioning protein
MTIQTISLSQLVPSKGNPRKLFEVASLEGLAASIRSDGLLQNLVVRPSRGKSFAIISGERRYRALKLLEERGELPEGFTIPVEVRANISKDDSLRLATVENLQRADLTPLEQTEALTKLVKDGEKLDDLTAQTGLSATTIKRRLALNALGKDARAALEAKAISLAQAEALTLAPDDMQQEILQEIERGRDECSPASIRSMVLDERPCVADAIFPLERYSGTITTDLFAEGETSYFDDLEQFIALQKEAVSELAAHYGNTATWVEVTEGWRVPRWQYEDAPEGEPGGVLININPRGIVELREGLIKVELDKDTAEALTENPIAPPKVKAFYTTPLRKIIGHCKSAAVGELLLSSPRTAKEVAAVILLDNLKPHEAYADAAKQTERQKPFEVLDAQARLVAQRLGFTVTDGETGWEALSPYWSVSRVSLYETVKTLTDHELDELHTLIVALTFGQSDCERLDVYNSFFNRVAQDLKADMRNHWSPDRAFLSRRNREQLLEIAKANGAAEGRSGLASYKKSELVDTILFHDRNARQAVAPTPEQRKALDWLPEAMRFPAVDPDAQGTADEPDEDAIEADDLIGDEGDALEDEAFEDEPVREAA